MWVVWKFWAHGSESGTGLGVKKNIEAFGGDPDNITLFGESVGAVMIGLHLLV
jgi:Carboxylesterase type B